MAIKRMLVDAIHPEETRIVVTSGNRLEEFDFESAQRRQLRGNIYLAKVTRVEPSLQAAFVDYGGNRHGFLAFSEIHPDYYQIPVADREALLRDEEEEDHNEAEAEIAETSVSQPADDDGEQDGDADGDNGHIEQAPRNNEPVESVGGSDALEEMPERRKPSPARRNYKIQEVIKRRQVMLVQVVKEERGNKGAALTTYLSLAGRYSVLMPNTARGGGISRKITNAADRKRLKEIVGDLEVPQGQGIILRTAGASRTKAEVKRDFEYLQRLWENVRSLTLKSQAPCLVYEEGSLIKRTIRDLYSKEIDELMVAGVEAHREAKDFMRMIMPSHAKNVQLYTDDQPIFSRFNIEPQLDQMFSPQVTLPSGGYIVINPTEALVSIDVNSGRSTKEHNIEDTALQTNLEAAEEVARQLRLRDLAGLIVIDFIDMTENRSNRAVERKLKDCLKNDRARIQVGRISHFGLMEMSRQRIRFGVVESSTHKCPTCDGTGIVRSVESIALLVMRAIEDHVLRKPGQSINVKVPTDVALYLLNNKRQTLTALEAKHGLSITLLADDHVGSAHYLIERGEARPQHHSEVAVDATHVRVDTAAMDDLDDAAVDEDDDAEEAEETPAAARSQQRSEEGGERSGRRRRRRRRGGDRDESTPAQQVRTSDTDDEAVELDQGADEDATEAAGNGGDHDDSGEPRKRRRRGRRGGRRNRRNENGELIEDAPAEAVAAETRAPEVPEEAPVAAEAEADAAPVIEAPQPAEESPAEPETAPAAAEAPVEDTPPAKPKRTRRKKVVEETPAAAADAATIASVAEAVLDPALDLPPVKPKRTRRKKADPVAVEEVEATASVREQKANPPEELAPPPTDPILPEPVLPEAAAPAAEQEDEKPARRRRKELPADEIVVSSTAAPAEEVTEGEEKPKKKAGWWQRGFLGG
ncbi:ribonuclease E/G [Arsenicitalea aurantiaca]|uniref:Ribonuclease E n=1 Tax=Arsenicitalea aurantiaca TaxID=1783274 RepID=A0A433XFY4_9HYPH|nr:ribonuclease E/G [Arsenicitalea aurantiaca]RUT32924.1 ribonuclease E/G [Arsenicitalea aurantiaca]